MADPREHRSPLVSMLRHASTCLTAASMVLALPLQAHAGQPAQAVEEPAGESDIDEAEAIFQRGQAKYETADYAGAIELWTEAYALVASTPENAAIKALLIFNLAQAHVKAFEFDEDPIHLKQARQLLESYQGNLELLYEDEAARAEEQAKVDERLTEIADKLAALEAAAEPEPKPEPQPTPQPPVDQGKPGKPFVSAGIAVTTIGAVIGGGGIIIGGLIGAGANDIGSLDPDDLDAREDQFAAGRSGNSLFTTGTVIALTLIPTGIALLVIGKRKNKKAEAERQAKLEGIAPVLGSGQAGLVLNGRF